MSVAFFSAANFCTTGVGTLVEVRTYLPDSSVDGTVYFARPSASAIISVAVEVFVYHLL